MQTEIQKKRTFRWHFREDRWIRRGLYLAIATLFFIAIANTFMQLDQRGETALISQTERQARLNLSLAKHEARIWFLEENEVAMESLANYLQEQDDILEVAIQDEWGQTIVRAGHDLPVHEYLQTLPDVIWAVPMVETVLDREGAGANLLGFIRITFDYDRIMSDSRPFHRSILSENAYLTLLAFFAGFMVAVALIRRRKTVLIRGRKHEPESDSTD